MSVLHALVLALSICGIHGEDSYVWVTSQTLPEPSVIDSLAYVDSFCKFSASQSSKSSISSRAYLAFALVSHPEIDLIDRIDGDADDDVKRPDGVKLVDEYDPLSDLFSNAEDTISVDENGNVLTVPVVTATSSIGEFKSGCGGWTGTGTVTVGDSDSVAYAFDDGSISCDSSDVHIYCMVGEDVGPWVDDHINYYPKDSFIFVSDVVTGPFPSDLDQFCNDQAQSSSSSLLRNHGENMWRALVSTSAYHANEIVRDSNAIFSVFGEQSNEIREVANNANHLFNGNGLNGHINRDKNGYDIDIHEGEYVMTGSDFAGYYVEGGSCNDFTSRSSSLYAVAGELGSLVSYLQAGIYNPGNPWELGVPCDRPTRFYCFFSPEPCLYIHALSTTYHPADLVGAPDLSTLCNASELVPAAHPAYHDWYVPIWAVAFSTRASDLDDYIPEFTCLRRSWDNKLLATSKQELITTGLRHPVLYNQSGHAFPMKTPVFTGSGADLKVTYSGADVNDCHDVGYTTVGALKYEGGDVTASGLPWITGISPAPPCEAGMGGKKRGMGPPPLLYYCIGGHLGSDISNAPTSSPTTPPPTESPTMEPTGAPTTPIPSASPTRAPTLAPSESPTLVPTMGPTPPVPTTTPTTTPTRSPTRSPTHGPTRAPSSSPTGGPTLNPTKPPTSLPTKPPTKAPTNFPTSTPTAPTKQPTDAPSTSPTQSPTHKPTQSPTQAPAMTPTANPSLDMAIGGNENLGTGTSMAVLFGAILFVVVILGCAFLVFRQRKHNDRKDVQLESVPPVVHGGDADYDKLRQQALHTYNQIDDMSAYGVPQPTRTLTDITKSMGGGTTMNLERFLVKNEDLMRVKKIGEGSFGVVYKGKWHNDVVAIKEVKAGSKQGEEEFITEAVNMCDLRPHPNVVTLLGVCQMPACIVTEFCALGSLDELLKKKPEKFDDVDTVRQIVVGAASGLAHLHRQSIIHRDIAARNILVGAGMVPKVADFGMARAGANEDENLTAQTIGPIRWMAPEQLDAPVYSTYTDSYAFGVLLYEVYAREMPWAGVGNVGVVRKVGSGQRLQLSEAQAPTHAREVMAALFVEEPKQRPGMALVGEMLEDGYEALEEGEVYDVAAVIARHGSKEKKEHRTKSPRGRSPRGTKSPRSPRGTKSPRSPRGTKSPRSPRSPRSRYAQNKFRQSGVYNNNSAADGNYDSPPVGMGGNGSGYDVPSPYDLPSQSANGSKSGAATGDGYGVQDALEARGVRQSRFQSADIDLDKVYAAPTDDANLQAEAHNGPEESLYDDLPQDMQ